MKYFGTKRPMPADEDKAAHDRLSAIASRYRVDPDVRHDELPLDFPDPGAASDGPQ